MLGLTLAGDRWKCEIDVAAAVIDGPTTLAIVGEVKGGRDPIDSNDIANLERVQEALRQAGLDTLLLAATSRPRLSTEESAVLRRYCENAPDRLFSRGSTTPALPIVLTEPDFSRPWMSGDHPWRWGEPGDSPMAGLAEESCRRNLGLDDISYERTATGWTRRVVWADGS